MGIGSSKQHSHRSVVCELQRANFPPPSNRITFRETLALARAGDQSSSSSGGQATPSTKSKRKRAGESAAGSGSESPDQEHHQEQEDVFAHETDMTQFNVFRVSALSGNNALIVMGVRLFEVSGIRTAFQIPLENIFAFWKGIQDRYSIFNAYHHAEHGADVLQTMYAMIEQGGLRDNGLQPLDILAALIASGAHDIEHPGVNNMYLINTADELALRYNDASVLENHHAAATFDVLRNTHNANILAGLDTEAYRECRKTIIEMILATDNAKHFHHVAEFQTFIDKKRAATPHARKFQLTLTSLDERRMVLKYALHAADISAMTKPRDIADTWTERLLEEFFAQGDRERAQGMPISPLCDRSQDDLVPSQQMGFISNFVMPVVTHLCLILDNSAPLAENIQASFEKWNTVNTKLNQAKAFHLTNSPAPAPAPARTSAPAATPSRPSTPAAAPETAKSPASARKPATRRRTKAPKTSPSPPKKTETDESPKKRARTRKA